MKKKKNKCNLLTNYKLGKYLILSLWVITFLIININTKDAEAAELKTYTVKTSDTPMNNEYKKYSTYNENTRHYYMLRSYLEQLEKDGGGKLILTKGNYVITNVLYVPSNVKIILKDGANLIKGNKTGTAKLTPSKSMFELIAPSQSSKKAAVKKYNGQANISIIGEGTATIDLNYVKDAVGIVIGHNKNIQVQGITFQKMHGGNMIRIGASEKVMIAENVFREHKDSEFLDRAAIAIEIPDIITSSFNYVWSDNDKTISRNLTIKNNTFTKLERAITSLKYTENLYHKNINIIQNDISHTESHAIRILNWENCTVTKNSFSNIKNKEGTLKAILVSGAKYPHITQNTFNMTDRAIQIMPWKNNGNGSGYKITDNTISKKNKLDMLDNLLQDMGEYFIRYNKTYNEFTKNSEKWEIYVTSEKDFTITDRSETFQNRYTNYSTYNEYTKPYYVLRSYLEHLERLGGGTLTLEPGTYKITNALYVPSNVTIKLKDGVTILKTNKTGVDHMISSGSIFQFVAPTMANVEGAYGGYEGERNIKLIGEGTAIIDLNFIDDVLAIALGHNTDVVISGITFQNMKGGHFIELDASKNVTIENNHFRGHKISKTGIKEAINIDTPDKTTEGFNFIWTKHDCTPNKDIMIRNNVFDDVERAIGTHKYSGGKYHENIQIINNEISNTKSDAIRSINWKKPIIKGNKIKNVAGGEGSFRAILASGIINPVITENTFSNVARPIQIMPWKNSGPGSQYDITYNTVSVEDIITMLKNELFNVKERFIRVNQTYNVFNNDTKKYYY